MQLHVDRIPLQVVGSQLSDPDLKKWNFNQETRHETLPRKMNIHLSRLKGKEKNSLNLGVKELSQLFTDYSRK